MAGVPGTRKKLGCLFYERLTQLKRGLSAVEFVSHLLPGQSAVTMKVLQAFAFFCCSVAHSQERDGGVEYFEAFYLDFLLGWIHRKSVPNVAAHPAVYPYRPVLFTSGNVVCMML